MIRILRETHECPAAITEMLARLSGTNPFREPIIRAIWGWNRLTLVGGKWALTDSNGNFTGEHEEWAWVPLYTFPHFNPNRWYFEKWKSAEEFFGSPETWAKSNDGVPTTPYNSRGEYDHIFTLERDGEFVQLTASIAAEVVRRHQRKQSQSKGEKKAINNSQARHEEQDYDSFADSVLNDTNQFQGKIHVYQ